MNFLLSLTTSIAPCVITGFVTYSIARYNYDKSRPIEKMEIAYNKIYYPLYKIVRSNRNYKNTDINEFISKCSPIINKHKKYIDRTTSMAFEELKRTVDTNGDRKKAFEDFENNIVNKHSKLRIRLGYMEPSLFESFRYLPLYLKFSLITLIMVMVLYIAAIAYTAVHKLGYIQAEDIFLWIMVLTALGFVSNVIRYGAKFIKVFWIKVYFYFVNKKANKTQEKVDGETGK